MKESLPTKEQIHAISDRQVLGAIMDSVDLNIEHIEADLEFGDGDDDWASRARGALAHHRFLRQHIARRLEKLKKSASQVETPERPWHDNSAETRDAITNKPTFDPNAQMTLEDAGAWAIQLDRLISAVEADRSDEIALIQKDRDVAFITLANDTLAHLRRQRVEVSAYCGHIRKRQRIAETDERASARAQVFIDCARHMLPRETFVAIWDRVDAMGTNP